MGKTIAAQHPAVVLRSHYKQLRALLATAMIAVVGLSAAVVILATNDDQDTSAGTATPVSAPGPAGDTRYDGGPEEGSRGVAPAQPPLTREQAFPGLPRGTTGAPADGRRYDGGPDEGTASLTQRSASATLDLNSVESPPGLRYDGGPEEGTRGPLTAPSSPSARYDGGPEEGSRGSGH
jgi:hypothetical protein